MLGGPYSKFHALFLFPSFQINYQNLAPFVIIHDIFLSNGLLDPHTAWNVCSDISKEHETSIIRMTELGSGGCSSD
jgi:hypothetical protein